MTNIPKNIRISDISFVRNMVLPHYVPTSTESILLMIQKSQNILTNLYLIHGNKAVWIVNTSKSLLVPMLRNTLISLLVCRSFILQARFAKDSTSLDSRLSELALNLTRKYRRVSVYSLYRELIEEKQILTKLFSVRMTQVLKIDYIPSVFSLSRSLILAELNYIQLYADSLPSELVSSANSLEGTT